jgi:hypothetical protein
MRTECIDPRYGLNPQETYWIYSDEDLNHLIRSIENGQIETARHIVKERRFPLCWQSNK